MPPVATEQPPLSSLSDEDLLSLAKDNPPLGEMSDEQLTGLAVKQGLMQPGEAAEAVRQKKQTEREPVAEGAAEAIGAAGNIPAPVAKMLLTAGGRPGDVAAQVLSPILGGVAGGAAGTAVEPGGGTVAGAFAGRAAGGALGDTLAQAREYFRGDRDTFGKGELAVNTALSAIPLGGALLKTPARVIATRAAQGFGLGAAGETARQAIDEHQLDFKGIVEAGGLGALFGAGAGGLEARATRRAVLQAIRQTPEFHNFAGNDSDLVQAVRDRMAPPPEAPANPRNVTPEAATEPVALRELPAAGATPGESAGPVAVPAPPGPEIAPAARAADIPPGINGAPAGADYRYTVQRPLDLGGGHRVPGYVQIDELVNGQNTRSSNLEALRQEGINLPDVPEHLPTGQYTLGEIHAHQNEAPPASGDFSAALAGRSPEEMQRLQGRIADAWPLTAEAARAGNLEDRAGQLAAEKPVGWQDAVAKLQRQAQDIRSAWATRQLDPTTPATLQDLSNEELRQQLQHAGGGDASSPTSVAPGEQVVAPTAAAEAGVSKLAGPKQIKVQKDYLLQAVNKAAAAAQSSPEFIALNKALDKASAKGRVWQQAEFDKKFTDFITFQVPGDGTYRIHNVREALEAFGAKVQKQFGRGLKSPEPTKKSLPRLTADELAQYRIADERPKAAALGAGAPRTAAMGAAAPRPSAGAQRVQGAQLRTRMTQQNASGLPAAAAVLVKAAPVAAPAKWFRGIRAIVAPQTLDDQARRMSHILRAAFGREYAAGQQADNAMHAFRKEFDRTPVPRGWAYDPAEPLPHNYEVMSRIDTGRVHGLTPSEQSFVKVMRAELDRMIDWVHQVSPHSMRNLMENYMARVWKDPTKNQDKLNLLLGHSPLEGPKTFLKKRVLEYFTDGLKLGLVPASDNPVDLTMQKIGEMARFASTRQAMEEAKAAGLRKFKYVYEQMPEGWRAVDDPSTEVWKPPTVTIKEAYDAQLRAKTIEMLRSLGIAHERVTKLGGQRWGEANEVTGIKTRFGGLDAVFWHEAGHMLDWRFPELRKLTGAMDRGPKGDQMRALADLRHEGQQVPKSFKAYVRKTEEKIANMFDAYIRAPDKFKAVAPDVWRDFNGWLQQHPEVSGPLNAIRPGLTLGSSSQEMFVGGPIKLGDWIMPEGAAQVLRNYLQPGLGRFALFRGTRDVMGLVNGMQLIGLFHLALVALDSVYSGASMALYDAMMGKPTRAFGELQYALPAYGQVKLLISGHRVLGALRDPAAASAASKQIAELAMRTNLRAGHGVGDGEMARQWARAMREVWQQPSTGAAFEAFWRTPFAVMQTLMVPVMRGVVPRLKLAVFARMAERVMADNPNASQAELDAKLAQAADATENRLGQVTYNNLFMNRVLKDVLQVLMRAAGWQITKYRMTANAAADWARAARDAASGKKPTVTFDMTYTAAMLAIHAMIAATATYILTGHSPKELLDYIFPDTGLKDPQTGRAVRASIPDFVKDYYADIHYFPDPKMMAVEWSRKLTPGLSMASQMANNRDYWGTQIFSERMAGEPEMEHLLHNLGEGASYLAHTAGPFSLSAGKRFVDAGANPVLGYAAPILGITPAPRYATETPMQNFLSEQRGSKGYTETLEQAQHAKMAREISQALRDQKPLTAEQQVAMRTLSKQQLSNAEKRVSMDPDLWAIRGLSLDTAMRAWDLANKDERQKIGPTLMMKVSNAFKAGGHDPATLKRYLRVLSRP